MVPTHYFHKFYHSYYLCLKGKNKENINFVALLFNTYLQYTELKVVEYKPISWILNPYIVQINFNNIVIIIIMVWLVLFFQQRNNVHNPPVAISMDFYCDYRRNF